MRLIHIPLILLLLTFIPIASADTQYTEGYSLDGLSKVTPSSAEQSLGVLHKYTNDDVIICIAEDGIRFTAITDTGNAWVQYDFNNPSSVQPTINTSEKSATWSSIYSNVDIKYTLIPAGLKQELVVYDTPQSDVFRETVSISEGLTLEKVNGEWLFSKDGVRVFSLQKPYAVDANGTEFTLDLTKRIEGSSLYLEIDASTALEDCAFPLVIDPTTYSGGYLSFWGLDIYDLPTLYSVTNNSSYISYDAGNTTYTFHVPVYQNSSSHVMSMDNATILLKSNNDGAPAYIRWAGQCDFSDLNVFGWDTVALEFAPSTDTTRAYVYCDAGATGDITDCNMSYLGYNADGRFGVQLIGYSENMINNFTSIDGYWGLSIGANSANNTISDVFINASSRAFLFRSSGSGNVASNLNITSQTSYAIYILSTASQTLNDSVAYSPSNYAIYLNNADDNTFTNCTGNSSSSYGIYIYAGSTGNEFNYCDFLTSANRAAYIYDSSHTNTFEKCTFNGTWEGIYIRTSNNCEVRDSSSISTSVTVGGIRTNTALNFIADNCTVSAPIDYDVAFASTFVIINPNNIEFTVLMEDAASQLTIENTDGQLFNETATATAYSYQNGTFQMYETGTAETFTITQYDSFLDSTTANSTVLGVPHATSSINVTSGTLDSWITSDLTPSAYYELLTGGTTIDFLYADTGGNVTVTDDLTTGVYYLTPATTYNVSGYVFDDDTLAAIEGATVNRAGVQSTTTNATGYYILAVYNSTSTFTASANGYNYNQTDITVDGAPLTDQNFTLTAEQPNYVPLPLYLVLLGIMFGSFYFTFPREHDEEGETMIGVSNIVAGLLATIVSFVNAKIIINGQLVQTFAGVTSADTIAIDHSIIQASSYGYLLQFVGVLAAILTGILVYKYFSGTVEEDDEYGYY